MLDLDSIRQMSIDGHNDKIRSALLTKKQREVFLFIRDIREATTSDVSHRFGISVQHASGILTKLYKKMYLRRYEKQQDSGGYEFNYFL